MPHLIFEHSSDIKNSAIKNLQVEIQNIMASIVEGNFDPDQCKCRIIPFDEYLVGRPDQSKSSFIHITIKILSGRTLEAKQKLAQKTLDAATNTFVDLVNSPNEKSRIIETAHELADAISGVPHIQLPVQNSALANKRCDLSVDIVDMDRETYQKIRIGN